MRELAAAYKAINPQALVPSLDDGGRLLTQSLAIIEYLNERFPEPPLLPAHAADRATVRSMALLVACEIHPIQNLRVLAHLKNKLSHSDDDVDAWARHWIELGFGALEESIDRLPDNGFCFGDRPSLADICLVPQMGRVPVRLRPLPFSAAVENKSNKTVFAFGLWYAAPKKTTGCRISRLRDWDHDANFLCSNFFSVPVWAAAMSSPAFSQVQELLTVNVNGFSRRPGDSHSPVERFLRRAGIEVIMRTANSTDQMRGLSNGTYQIASTAFDNVLGWSGREGAELIAVAQIIDKAVFPVFGATRN